MQIERRDEPGGQVVLGCAHGDSRRERCDRLVADVLVDHVGGFPEARDINSCRAAQAVENVDQRLPRNAMQSERQRVDGGRHKVGAEACRDQRVGEPGSRSALDVEPDRQTARFGQPANELLGHMRRQRARWIVDDDARRAELGQSARLLDESLDAAVAPWAVDETCVELATGGDDRLTGLAQVRDVVQRIVQAEDIDPVRRRRCDEAAHDIGAHRLRADEEAAAQSDPERRRRARVNRTDPLPRALHPAPHGRIEHAAAGDFEARKPCKVEDRGDPQHLAGRHLAGEWLLREQPNRRVHKLRHSARHLSE